MQGFSVHFCIFVWRVIADIYCQTFFQEKRQCCFSCATIAVYVPLSSVLCVRVCVSAVDMTTVAMLVSVFLWVSGLCLLPTTLRMFVSIRAENLWCPTCVSNNTQPRWPGKGLRVGGYLTEGGSRSGTEGKGTAVVWMSC